MQDLKIDELLDNVMMNAANVCGNLTTIRTSFDELKKGIEDNEILHERLYFAEELITELSKENDKLKKEIESRKKAFNDLKEEMANRYITVETHNDICKTYEINNTALKNQVDYLEKELNESYKAWDTDSKNYQKRDMTLVDELAKKNEEIKKLKTEITEALAKRDYWQNLANKEAADAKKVKLDCEKEIEWQKKKLQEFDCVLTKYRAKIKELEDANRFFKLMINLIIKE